MATLKATSAIRPVSRSRKIEPTASFSESTQRAVAVARTTSPPIEEGSTWL